MENMNLSNGGYVVLPAAEYNELITKLARVVVPVSDYNELITKLARAEDAIRVKEWSYNQHKNLEVIISPEWLYEIAMAKAATKFDLSQYDVRKVDEFYISSATLGDRKAAPPEPVEPIVKEE